MSYSGHPKLKITPNAEREAARGSVPPIESACPNCQAKPESPCTAPTDTGRREVRWFHHARVSAALDGGAP